MIFQGGQITINGLGCCVDAALSRSYISGASTWYNLIGLPDFTLSNITKSGSSISMTNGSGRASMENFIFGSGGTVDFMAKTKGALTGIVFNTEANSPILIRSGISQSGAIFNYFAFTWLESGSSLYRSVYLNGQLVANDAASKTFQSISQVFNLNIVNSNLTGSSQIALLRLYDRALTHEEISNNFSAQKTRFGL